MIKENSLAIFTQDESGKIVCTLKIDYKDFDISLDDYFNGTDEITPQEYELIYKKVVEACNLNNEGYTIDCWGGRYTVQKFSDLEKIHYNKMSSKEKKEYDTQKSQNELKNTVNDNKYLLQIEDYKIIKCMEAFLTNSPMPYNIEELKTKRDKMREIINQLENSNEIL